MNVQVKIETTTDLKPKDIANITKGYMHDEKLRSSYIKEIAIKTHETFKTPLKEIFFAHIVNAEEIFQKINGAFFCGFYGCRQGYC